MSTLFSPIILRDLTLANRIVVSPMCQYVAKDGRADAWHLVHLATLALSGAALVIVEATAVEPAGRITAGDLGLYDDATEAAFGPVLATIRQQSSTAVGIQLAHAGRKASCQVPWEGGSQIPPGKGGWECFAPSAVAQSAEEERPSALDTAGLDRVRVAFDQAARRAARLGFDAVEVHGAHGYLLHEFLSPLANRRTDEYGGSLENRMRFPLEIFDIVRAAVPAGRPIGVKLSATDWVEGGWDLGQSVSLARVLREHGADWVTASSGGTSPLQRIGLGPGYQVPFAEGIKQGSGVVTMAVGLITEAEQAERIVASGQADVVALARGMLYDPRWGWHAAAALGATVDAPPPYWRAPPHQHKDLFNTAARGPR